ncbi:hypothetical protein ACIBCA_36340 [Kitasatospora sp. NPDC051170]|uniref:hypothetical protein n=1 Tax=Kitasatospora sp. NPDC051170 TaxID=3364056 RepID=UPI0037B76D19
MSTNPTAPTAARPTTLQLRDRARTWQGVALGWTAVALQRTVAGAGIRQKYKAHRDRAIRAALRRGVPLDRLARAAGPGLEDRPRHQPGRADRRVVPSP